jgi:hypothetical protein
MEAKFDTPEGYYARYVSLPVEIRLGILKGLEQPPVKFGYGTHLVFHTAKDRDIFMERVDEETLPTSLSVAEMERFYRLTDSQQNHVTYLLRLTVDHGRLDDPDCLSNIKRITFETPQEKKLFLERLKKQEEIQNSPSQDVIVDILLAASDWNEKSSLSVGVLCAMAGCDSVSLSKFASVVADKNKDLQLLKSTLLDKNNVVALLLETFSKMKRSHCDMLSGLVGLDLHYGNTSVDQWLEPL